MSLGPQIADIIVNNQIANFQHWTKWGPPLKNQNFEKHFFACLKGPKNRPRAKFS